MNLQEKINIDIKMAMKNKDTDRLSILRVVKGEINRIGKDLSDDEIIKIIRKMKENSDMNNNKIESDILNEYLPSMLEEKQLEVIIHAIIYNNGYNSMKDMKNIMSELKTNYGASVDGKLASTIIKNKLNN